MAAHALFENKYVTLHELIYLSLLAQMELDEVRISQTVAQFGWEAGFGWLMQLCAALAAEVDLEIDLPGTATAVSPRPNWHLPYLLPLGQTFRISWHKYLTDLKAGRWRRAGRQLFSYTLVDGVWMMRKARRKCQWVEPV